MSALFLLLFDHYDETDIEPGATGQPPLGFNDAETADDSGARAESPPRLTPPARGRCDARQRARREVMK